MLSGLISADCRTLIKGAVAFGVIGLLGNSGDSFAQTSDVAASERLFRGCVATKRASDCDELISNYSGWTQTPRWALAKVHVERALMHEARGDYVAAYKDLQTAQTVKFSRTGRRLLRRVEQAMRRNGGAAAAGGQKDDVTPRRGANRPDRIRSIAPQPRFSSDHARRVIAKARQAQRREERKLRAAQRERERVAASRRAALVNVPLPIARPADAPVVVAQAEPEVVQENNSETSDPIVEDAGRDRSEHELAVVAQKPASDPEPAQLELAKLDLSDVIFADHDGICMRSLEGGVVPSEGMKSCGPDVWKAALGKQVVVNIFDRDADAISVSKDIGTVAAASDDARSPTLRVQGVSLIARGRRTLLNAVTWDGGRAATSCVLKGPDQEPRRQIFGLLLVDRPEMSGAYQLTCKTGDGIRTVVADALFKVPVEQSEIVAGQGVVLTEGLAQNSEIVSTLDKTVAAAGVSRVFEPAQVLSTCEQNLSTMTPADHKLALSQVPTQFSVNRGLALKWEAGGAFESCQFGPAGDLKHVATFGTRSGLSIGKSQSYVLRCARCDGTSADAEHVVDGLKAETVAVVKAMPRHDPFEPQGRNWLMPMLATMLLFGAVAIMLKETGWMAAGKRKIPVSQGPQSKQFSDGRAEQRDDEHPEMRPLFVRQKDPNKEFRRSEVPTGGDRLEPLVVADPQGFDAPVASHESLPLPESTQPVSVAIGDDDVASALAVDVEQFDADNDEQIWIEDAFDEALVPDDDILAPQQTQPQTEADADADATVEADAGDPSGWDDVVYDPERGSVFVAVPVARRAYVLNGADVELDEDDSERARSLFPTSSDVGAVNEGEMADTSSFLSGPPVPSEVDDGMDAIEADLVRMAEDASDIPSDDEASDRAISILGSVPPLDCEEANVVLRCLDTGNTRVLSPSGLAVCALLRNDYAEQTLRHVEDFLRVHGAGELVAALSSERVTLTDQPSGFDLASLANAVEKSHLKAQVPAFADAFSLLLVKRALPEAGLNPQLAGFVGRLFSCVRELLLDEPSMRFAQDGFELAKQTIRDARAGADVHTGSNAGEAALHDAVKSVVSMSELFDVEMVRFAGGMEALLACMLTPLKSIDPVAEWMSEYSFTCAVPLSAMSSDVGAYSKSILGELFRNGSRISPPMQRLKETVRSNNETIRQSSDGRALPEAISELFDKTPIAQIMSAQVDLPLTAMMTQPVTWIADDVADQRAQLMKHVVLGTAGNRHAFIWDQNGDLAASLTAGLPVQLLGLERRSETIGSGLVDFFSVHRAVMSPDALKRNDPTIFAAFYGDLLQAALSGTQSCEPLSKHQRAMLHICLRLVGQQTHPTMVGFRELLSGKPNAKRFDRSKPDVLATDIKRLKACFKGIPRIERTSLVSRISALWGVPVFAELFDRKDEGLPMASVLERQPVAVFEANHDAADLTKFALFLTRVLSRRHMTALDVANPDSIESMPAVRDGWDGVEPAFAGRLVVGLREVPSFADQENDLIIAHGSLPAGASGDSNVSGDRAMALSHVRHPRLKNWLPVYAG